MIGFNWVLIVIIVVLAILSVGVAIYLLISYQHPEDRTQAWLPKVVVLVGITISIWTVLLFPLDIANRNSCSDSLPASFCTFAIPSKLLWYILYITNAFLVFGGIPFAIFYYEADSELWDFFSLRIYETLLHVQLTPYTACRIIPCQAYKGPSYTYFFCLLISSIYLTNPVALYLLLTTHYIRGTSLCAPLHEALKNIFVTSPVLSKNK